MHLLYVGVYDDGEVNGIKLSSKYEIKIEQVEDGDHDPTVKVNIEENARFIKNFFGARIFDIAAVVGKNGSGKTSLAHRIMNCAPEALKMRIDEVSPCFFIYEEKQEKDADPCIRIIKHKINVICNRKEELRNKDDSKIFFQPVLYLSNVFNPSEFRDSFTTGDININSLTQQRMYTPALIMKRNQNKRRKAYHQYYDIGYNAALYELAEIQMRDMVRVYEDYQAVSFLNCYFHAPDSVKGELSIFDQIAVRFHPFAGELRFDQEEQENWEKWFSYIQGELNEQDQIPDKPYFSVRYAIEYCKCFVYARCLNNDKPGSERRGWKRHVLASLFSEAALLIFGEVLEIIMGYYYKMLMLWDISNIEFWVGFKDALESILESGQCHLDKRHIQYTRTVFYKLYKEAEQIIQWNEGQDCTDGLYRIKEIEDFLKFYEKSYLEDCIWTKYCSLELQPTSSGELALVNLMSYIYQAFADVNGNKEDMLIIMDELDAYMHPRWQQSVLDWLLKWWDQEEVFNHSEFQLLFTTHSPILLSDIPSDRVTCIDRDHFALSFQPPRHKTFGADIYTLFYDSFFMEKGSIGEFAKGKVNELINWLSDKESKIDEKEALYLIDSIGDHHAVTQLKQMYEKKKSKQLRAEAFRMKLENLSPEEQKILTEYIQKMER